MSAGIPDDVRATFDEHEAYENRKTGYDCTTTSFEGIVTATTDGDNVTYTVTVTVPTIDAVTRDEVPEVVETDWLETFERRLENAPKATRTAVSLATFSVTAGDETVTITYGFDELSPPTAAEVAKTFIEYVEGTFVEGIIPGYEYEGVAAELLSQASGRDERGTPL